MPKLSAADLQLGLALFEIFAKAKATLDDIKTNAPEVYAQISAHHANVQAAAKAVDPD